MLEILKFPFEILIQFWNIILTIPIWIKILCGIPLFLFTIMIIMRTLILINNIIFDRSIDKKDNMEIRYCPTCKMNTVIEICKPYDRCSVCQRIYDINVYGEKDNELTNQLIQDPKKKKQVQGVEKCSRCGSSLYFAVAEIEQSIKGVESVKLQLNLTEQFNKINYTQGAIKFNKLSIEYENLNKIFTNNIDTSLINVNKIKTLTTNIYNQGIGILNSILTIAQQLNNTNEKELTDELLELQENTSKFKGKTLQLISERVDKINNSLKIVKGYKDKCDELLCEVGLCIDSIREIRLQLPELTSHRPKEEFDKIVFELGSRINYAQRLHDEYKRQGI